MKKISTITKCIPDLFWEEVKQSPNNIAVIYDNKHLTYGDLAQHSSELATYLQYLGTEPDNCVGIFVEPSIELMIGIWGTLIAGGAYLPLSPEYPEERLIYMINDSKPKIIITQEELKVRVSELVPQNTQIITLNDVDKFKKENVGNSPFVLQANCISPNNLAYIIYTSGSSGKPKGVMIEHKSIVNQMQWLKKTFNLNNQSNILQKTPMSFDAAQWEILSPSCGCQVIMGSPGIYKNPEKLIETILNYNVNVLQCVPTLLQALIDTNQFHNCTTLKQLFSGGEPLSKNLVLQCTETLPQTKIINLYGPTECTINTSAFVINPDTVVDGPNNISIGFPIDNTQYYILDKSRKPVAHSEIGELYIGGDGLARGYFERPELTSERFIPNPFALDDQYPKLYRTGDLALWNTDGTVQCAGRADNQVKLRGFRIELDEIKLAIENHHWVKNAAVILKEDPATSYQNLIAFIELDSKEATLMDQGNHDAHHQSKESKAQVMMQLSNSGGRNENEDTKKLVVDLPGSTPTKKQKELVFARKTYRFFEGAATKSIDILKLLENKTVTTRVRDLENLNYRDFGQILRYFGQYISKERLLPKYGYASPGAMYATQMYFELNNVGELKSGYYYYNPVHHQLVLIHSTRSKTKTEIKIHFVGKKSAIEPIYKNNIQEVLEIETGHMIGLFEKILPEYGLNVIDCNYDIANKECLDVAAEDFYLGTFQIVSAKESKMDDLVDIYVGVHPGKIDDLRSGQYHYNAGKLEKISEEIIAKKHVIAINQDVYDRSSFGITVVSKTSKNWMGYINLGRKLQSLQMNGLNIGFMSSGYSSKTGNDLPSAKRIREIIGTNTGPSYFFIGGRVSDEQLASCGMKEDVVHMKGPAEMLRDSLINFLPDYMLPNKVIVLNQMPLTANGKIDLQTLKAKNIELVKRKYVAPKTEVERKISQIWKHEIIFKHQQKNRQIVKVQPKQTTISTNDNFFELGGNSLIAVSLVNKINQELNTSLPLQVLFEAPTIEKLALKVTANNTDASNRLIKLQERGHGKPVYCWPGLGGYCMNLRPMAKKLGIDRAFYGIQAYGINPNETAFSTIKEMAAEDIKMIKKLQPHGPYTLWGYSFGARVAFEAAYQLEQAGDRVENLFLIAPGSPKMKGVRPVKNKGLASYDNKTYVTILFSVFMGTITGYTLNKCLAMVHDEESFVKYITQKNTKLDVDLVKRIVKIVAQTYEFKYSFNELKNRQLKAPITIFKATGDDYSFIENSEYFSLILPNVVELKADHYSILKNSGVGELVCGINQRLSPHLFCKEKNNQSIRRNRKETILQKSL